MQGSAESRILGGHILTNASRGSEGKFFEPHGASRKKGDSAELPGTKTANSIQTRSKLAKRVSISFASGTI